MRGPSTRLPRLPLRPFPDRGFGHCSPASCTRTAGSAAPKGPGATWWAAPVGPAPGRPRGHPEQGPRRGTHERAPMRSRGKQTSQAPAAARKVAFDHPFRSKLPPFPQENKCK